MVYFLINIVCTTDFKKFVQNFLHFLEENAIFKFISNCKEYLSKNKILVKKTLKTNFLFDFSST